jgi:2-hydroxy-3-oxopropionate reductase
MNTSISILGLGTMGRIMARQLLAAGFPVHGWNRSPLSNDLTDGIPLCQKLEEAAHAEVCLMMLQDSTAVNEVLELLEPHLSGGQVVLDMGSSNPTHSKIHAQRLASKGIGWVDAPVSGGPEGAASGSLAIMAGGIKENVERVRPILKVLGQNVVHVGTAGMGHMVKVVNQLVVGLTIEAVAEALTLAEKSGVDPSVVQQALKGGFADSKILQLHGTRMINRAYDPGAKASIQLKDLLLAKDLADQAALKLPHLESTIKFYETLVSQGDEDLDHSVLHKLLWI